jgi:formyl-CoA transferase
VLAEGLVTTLPHPVVGSYRGVAHPIRFGRTPGPAPFAAPVLGQDNDAVLGPLRKNPGDGIGGG